MAGVRGSYGGGDRGRKGSGNGVDTALIQSNAWSCLVSVPWTCLISSPCHAKNLTCHGLDDAHRGSGDG